MVLLACRPETQAPTPKPTTIVPKSASTPIAASESTSDIVSQILNSPQEQDILASSKQAMENVTASEVAAIGASAVAVASSAAVEVAEPTAPAVHLPETCERYYQRVDRCFAKQPENSEELRQMNQDARLDLVADKPTDKTCAALNESFNGVARNLGCE
ncbi:hypothetical protein BWP33_08610 [Simonsiella muelleri ATCC 29453]|uniref:Uncharacterized protein n=1 Tax=Simonsiella muelleri ATCC 29453 TaxID=641147 RepID=V9HL53_9NEIS|nr:hypothetical protein BWP33_08610 [Simonsiella muelleri ATCC 29453]EFG30191.2 hypothetical protein HMPREF9021_01960 [Simonsiella muelleri ATCC 29453]